MNFKPSKTKIILSVVVGLLGLFGEFVFMNFGRPLLITQIINCLFAFLVSGGFIYLVLSLTDKKK